MICIKSLLNLRSTQLTTCYKSSWYFTNQRNRKDGEMESTWAEQQVEKDPTKRKKSVTVGAKMRRGRHNENRSIKRRWQGRRRREMRSERKLDRTASNPPSEEQGRIAER